MRDKLLKECDKLAKMPSGSHEATVVRNYLDTCLSMPWNTKSKDSLDLALSLIHIYTVTFDFEGRVDGELFDGGQAENYTLTLGSGQMCIRDSLRGG